jgi:hypothetical protein
MSSGVPRSRKTGPAPIWAALVLISCLSMLGRFVHPSTRDDVPAAVIPFVSAAGPGGDYYQFWLVGRAVSNLGIRNVYTTENRKALTNFGQELARSDPSRSKRLAVSAQLRRRMIQTFSTPFLYAVIGSVSTGDYERDFDAYLDLCLVALLLSIFVVGHLLGFSAVECMLFAAVLLVCSAPLSSDLWWGNVNQIQLGGLALYLLSRRWPDLPGADVSGGFLLGLLVAFKPTLAAIPLVLGLAWVLERRGGTLWRHAAGAAVGLGFAFVVGCRFLGSWAAWQNWLAVLPTIDHFTPWQGNYSLARMLTEAWGRGFAGVQPTSALVLLGSVGATALLLWRSRLGVPLDAAHRRRWFERDLGAAILGSGISVVSLNLVWEHYYLLLIPLTLYVSRASGLGLALPTLALLAVLGRPIAFLVDPESLAYTGVCIAGSWALLLLGLAAFQQRSRSEESTT